MYYYLSQVHNYEIDDNDIIIISGGGIIRHIPTRSIRSIYSRVSSSKLLLGLIMMTIILE